MLSLSCVGTFDQFTDIWFAKSPDLRAGCHFGGGGLPLVI